jgi:hypothetical protein
MNILVPSVLFAWPFVVLVIFALVSPRRAVLMGYVGAWLFLPMAGYSFQGLPDYGKVSAANVGVVLGIVICDLQRILKFRPHWIDLPMLLFCFWPMASSLARGYGPYDGLSAIFEQIVLWGVPYIVGRMYFNTPSGFRELAVAIVIGGLIYVPLCLIEIRMSPQLHKWVYGYYQHSFVQTIRFGGYRPMVFMQHGLAVAVWMINATLLALWMWSTGSLRRLCNLPMIVVCVALLVTTILAKSLGAIALMILGLASIFSARWLRHSWPLLVLIAIPPVWMIGRTSGLIDGQLVYEVFNTISPARAQSFAARLNQEDVVTKMAMRHPIVGGSRWWEFGNDQLWLIVFRSYGAVGLASITVALLLPPTLLLRRMGIRRLLSVQFAPLLGLSVIVVLFMMDNLLNGMNNPVFILAAGANAAAVAVVYRGKRLDRESPGVAHRSNSYTIREAPSRKNVHGRRLSARADSL